MSRNLKLRYENEDEREDVKRYNPRTAHGRELAELRRKMEAEGVQMLTPAQVTQEVRERRGGADA